MNNRHPQGHCQRCRQAGEERHQITVIRATGPGAPKVLMVLTLGARGLEQEQGVPRASGPCARALVMGTAPSRDSDRVRAKYLSFARTMGPGRCHDLGTTLRLLCHLGVCGEVRQAEWRLGRWRLR